MDELQTYLEKMFGSAGHFRPGQREAIEAVLEPGARSLVVQRTGWGKSIVYWIATRALRDQRSGPTVIVSPLLSLMRNQLEMAQRLGLNALTINSSNVDSWPQVVETLRQDRCDVLMVSPERFANESFLADVFPSIRSIGLFVVDEAHCISDWGHDFRPDYRRIQRILVSLPTTVRVLATTATANDRVVADVASQLGGSVEVQRGSLARESLILQCIELTDQAERLAWLAGQVPRLPGSGIVYCLTVADTTRVAAWLRTKWIDARAYNADLTSEERVELEDRLTRNDLKVLVATVALGMGFDKPDLGFVIHYQRPGSVIAYYQQVGRAGRALERAHAVLLTGREDDEIASYFIESAFPPQAHMETILRELERVETLSLSQLLSRVNLRRGQVEKALKLLEIDGAVAREGGRYFRTANPWSPDNDRIAGVTAARWAELAQMQAYTTHQGCLMRFLTDALDDPASSDCGHCANDGAVPLASDVDVELVIEAQALLKRDRRPIKTRLLWPSGAVPDLRGRIEPPNRGGFALSAYGDAGWGRLVADGKYKTGHFDQALVQASAEFILRHWKPEPGPRWLTPVPSTSRPGLLGAFGRELASTLGIAYREVLAAEVGSPQKTMENSAQQVRNAHDRLRVVSDVPPHPVLLVDDVVDSGWTLTVAGWLLRQHGAMDVFPFALADSSHRSGT